MCNCLTYDDSKPFFFFILLFRSQVTHWKECGAFLISILYGVTFNFMSDFNLSTECIRIYFASEWMSNVAAIAWYFFLFQWIEDWIQALQFWYTSVRQSIDKTVTHTYSHQIYKKRLGRQRNDKIKILMHVQSPDVVASS